MTVRGSDPQRSLAWSAKDGVSTPRKTVERRGAGRRMLVAITVVAAVAVGIAALSIDGSRAAAQHAAAVSTPDALARADASGFLHRYLGPDGRVVRTDQGGDTVSEGQAYALLLSAATGQAADFASAWHWEQTHLQLPSGLFAYRWSNGAVVSTQPATDADLLTAWALVLAGQRFATPGYTTAGQAVAAAVLANETVVVAGALQLAAGPWAVTNPVVVNPSYLAPEAMAALGTATGDPRWSELATSSTDLTSGLTGFHPVNLLPDWVNMASDGTAVPVGEANGTGVPAYGLDAQRSPVWLAASCSSIDRGTAARDWSVLEHVDDTGGNLSYSLSGRSNSRQVNPLGWVAAAGAASAAGHAQTATALLNQADQQSEQFHTYYGDAWAALGRVLLETNWLSPCPPIG
ncbi:MAG TPA: glycosyl hydrolase family 8 [Acidimicrobiales bacterium]|nr:glycosyl hydrolase family 8 [Acidimicrobiales bacterium]